MFQRQIFYFVLLLGLLSVAPAQSQGLSELTAELSQSEAKAEAVLRTLKVEISAVSSYSFRRTGQDPLVPDTGSADRTQLPDQMPGESPGASLQARLAGPWSWIMLSKPDGPAAFGYDGSTRTELGTQPVLGQASESGFQSQSLLGLQFRNESATDAGPALMRFLDTHALLFPVLPHEFLLIPLRNRGYARMSQRLSALASHANADVRVLRNSQGWTVTISPQAAAKALRKDPQLAATPNLLEFQRIGGFLVLSRWARWNEEVGSVAVDFRASRWVMNDVFGIPLPTETAVDSLLYRDQPDMINGKPSPADPNRRAVFPAHYVRINYSPLSNPRAKDFQVEFPVGTRVQLDREGTRWMVVQAPWWQNPWLLYAGIALVGLCGGIAGARFFGRRKRPA